MAIDQRKNLRPLPEYVRVCLISTLVWGLLAHGFALTNKFAMADELHYLFSVGSTVASGRWFLEILGKIVCVLFGSPNFSLPLTSGLLTIFFCGICSCILARWMELKNRRSWILISGLMVTFPVISGLFFYTFTAPYYLFALALVFLGSELLCKKRGILPFLGGVLLVVLGTSVYQAFVPLFLSLLLIYFILDVNARKNWQWQDLFQNIIWYCAAALVMICVYLLSVKVSTALVGQALEEYKGISSMGTTSLREYLNRVKLAFFLFFLPAKCDRNAFILTYQLLNGYYITLLLLGLLGAGTILRLFRKNPVQALSLALAFAVFPLASNFIYVTCASEDVYTLMQFGQLAPFLLLVCLCDRQDFAPTIHRGVKKAAALLLVVFCLFSVRIDNAIYTKADFIQTRAQFYFSTMAAQIKSTPGYTTSTPVTYVGDLFEFEDPTYQSIQGFSALTMTPLPYEFSPFCVICPAYDWQEFLDIWCGFDAPKTDSAAFEALPEVQVMPCYPNYGSIRMIGDTIVVKLQK